MSGPISATRSRLRTPARLAARQIYRYWQRLPLVPGSVLFESFGGTTTSGNPGAVFRQMRVDSRFRDRSFIWVAEGRAYDRKVAEFAHDPSVSVVAYRSRQYFKALATTEILINNVAFPQLFQKRPDQFYLNTWHGTPLKRMGRDALDSAPIENTVYNFRAADILLSTCDYMTDTMFRGAYGISGAKDQILQVGYPRIDVQFDEAGHERTREVLSAAGIETAGKRLIVYAPTWSQSQEGGVDGEVRDILHRVTAINAAIEPDDAIVLASVHPSLVEHAKGLPELVQFLVPEHVGTNELLGITDTLVTDYSSVFFDFLATGSQMLFFTPDAMAYQERRGLYLHPEDLPGPVTSDLRELIAWLGSPPRDGYLSLADARDRYCPREDGSASERVLAALPMQ